MASPILSDAEEITMVPQVRSVTHRDQRSRSFPTPNSPPSLHAHEPVALDPEPNLINISNWRAGISAANALDSDPGSRQHPPRYSVALGEPCQVYDSQEETARYEQPSGFRRDIDAGPGSSQGLSSRKLDHGLVSRNPFFAPPQQTSDYMSLDAGPPTYRPDRGSQEYGLIYDDIRTGLLNSDQQGQQILRPRTVVPNGSEIEGSGVQAESRAMGTLPNLLTLYGFPATKHHSHSSSKITPNVSTSRTNSDSFQTLGMLSLRKRHDSLLSTNSDVVDPDDLQEPDSNGPILDMLKLPFRRRTPKKKMTVIKKNVVGMLRAMNSRICGWHSPFFFFFSCVQTPELHSQVGEGTDFFRRSKPSHRVPTCLCL